PSCTRPARACDYDHILNFRDGGPTDSANGHRLCRFHHRAKTFADWTVTAPAPGVWLWTSPAERMYLVTGGTTTRLPGRDPATSPPRRKRDAA
ncbi:MAG: HNH endonuclease, partial [Actinomycetia bacterium]|nr:HNH endonuclease [Actinomycetes bacterium]